jgi:hypothetical protein
VLAADMNVWHVWVIVKHERCSHVKYGRKFVQLKLNNGWDVGVANIGGKAPLVVSLRSCPYPEYTAASSGMIGEQ